VVDALSSGRLRVRLDEASERTVRKTAMDASSALVFAVVLGSLIIGSAVIVHSGVPPLWNGIPLIGIVGFIAAGLVGFWLVIKIIRSGGL
jgi:ubiquinone biosynthesis protein